MRDFPSLRRGTTMTGVSLQRLERVIQLADESGAAAIARDGNALLERVHEGRFFVACLGQFKRGKSTVINALLGASLLPTGVEPITSVVTVVRFGVRRARVRSESCEWRDVSVDDLSLYVSERDNPENAKGITAIEVFCPSALLENGMCLVDTPGIGSVFRANTDETRAFLPQIDAALVVLGGDPPISGDELALVDEVGKRVHDVIFVMNKADRLSSAELREVRTFTESVLANHRSPPLPLLEISALERLERRGLDRDWPVLVRELERLSRVGRGQLIAHATSRGADALILRLRHALVEQLEALLRPLEESERRLSELRQCAANAEQSLVELAHLFNAEEQRLTQRFNREREQFVEQAIPRVNELLTARLEAAPGCRGPRFRRFALEQAQELTEPIVRAWMDELRPIVERDFAAVTRRFVAHANAFLERLRSSGELPTADLAEPLPVEIGLRARSHFYFHSLMRLTTPPLWLWLVDWFRTETCARVSARRAGLAFAKRLLEVNAHRVVGDLNERLIESRRGIETALRRNLHEVVTTAEQALQRATLIKERGVAAIHHEVVALDARLGRLSSLEREAMG